MKHFVITATVGLLLSGCAKKPPIEVRPFPREIAESEARDVVIRAITTNVAPYDRPLAVKVHRGSIDVTFVNIRFWLPLEEPITKIPSPKGNAINIFDLSLAKTELHLPARWRKEGTPQSSNNFYVTFPRQTDALPFVHAFNELVERNRAFLLVQENFGFLATRWRATSPKPELSENAVTQKILAEDAVKKNDPVAALRHFEAALQTDPTWPAGNLNVALLLANLGDHGAAACYIKRFLLLEPEGRDSALARKNVVIWEHEAMPAIPSNATR